MVLSLVIQILLDAATLSRGMKWLARGAAPFAAIAIAGGFFGLAFDPAFAGLLYLGAACLIVVALLAGIGLLRRPIVPAAGSASP